MEIVVVKHRRDIIKQKGVIKKEEKEINNVQKGRFKEAVKNCSKKTFTRIWIIIHVLTAHNTHKTNNKYFRYTKTANSKKQNIETPTYQVVTNNTFRTKTN